MPTVAAKLGVSYRAFRDHFTKHVGCSPQNFRIRKRLELACQLLQEHSVSQVSEILGYHDPYHFLDSLNDIWGYRLVGGWGSFDLLLLVCSFSVFEFFYALEFWVVASWLCE